MDQDLHVKHKTIKLEDNMGENPGDPGHVLSFKIEQQRHDPWKKWLMNWTSLKLKLSSKKDNTKRMESESHTGRKYLQKRHLKGTVI